MEKRERKRNKEVREREGKKKRNKFERESLTLRPKFMGNSEHGKDEGQTGKNKAGYTAKSSRWRVGRGSNTGMARDL